MKKTELSADDPRGIQIMRRKIMEGYIQKYLGSKKGRKKLADSMVQPLRCGGWDYAEVEGEFKRIR